MTKHVFEKVWKILGEPGKPNRWQELSAGAAFDYAVIKETHEGVHQWMFRRWNSFNIAVASACGLIFSFPFGYAIGIAFTLMWAIPVMTFMLIIAFMAVWSWNDTMNMLEFLVTTSNKPMPEPLPVPAR
jgi:hypothetical protein